MTKRAPYGAKVGPRRISKARWKYEKLIMRLIEKVKKQRSADTNKEK